MSTKKKVCLTEIERKILQLFFEEKDYSVDFDKIIIEELEALIKKLRG